MGVIVTALISMLIFLPRAIFVSPYPDTLLRSVIFVIIIGGVGILLSRLLANITERKRVEHDLNERVKELECLYSIANIVERPGTTLDELYQEVTNLLPVSWQYPEIACARIIINDKEFRTANYAETEWKQASSIKVHEIKTGVVEVNYLESRPEIDEGPFSKEERHLIDAVAERLGRITERMLAEEALVKAKDGLEIRVKERTAELAKSNEDLCQEISERKRAEDELRALSRQLVETQENERRAISRELHDQVGQSLTALGINLNIIQTQILSKAPGLLQSRMDESLSLVEQTTERIRDVMANLRPPVLDDYGLVSAVRWYGEQFATRTDIAVIVEGEEPVPRLDAQVENALFRIAQEALANAAKHAKATQVTVTVEVDNGTLRMVVADDGVGFDPARLPTPGVNRGWGLLTMRERAEVVGGMFRIESRPGSGTRLIVEVAR